MGHTSQTPNKQLPQFADDDKPTWLGDVNEAYRKIDAEFGRLQGVIDLMQSEINNKVDKP